MDKHGNEITNSKSIMAEGKGFYQDTCVDDIRRNTPTTTRINVHVKSKTIFDAVRSIGDIIEYTKLNNIPGLMTTFDFKKAFDSISWQFLTEALRSFKCFRRRFNHFR